MINLLQVLAILFAIFAITITYLRMREGKLSLGQFLFWLVLWLGIVALAMNPDLANFLSEALGIQRPIDAVIYGSVVLLFYLIFRLYVKISDVESDVTEIVTRVALKKK